MQIRHKVDKAGQAKTRPADSEADTLTNGKEIKRINGVEQKGGIYRVNGETDAMRRAKALAEKHGYRTEFFMGVNAKIENGGEVRGIVSLKNKLVAVRVDHPRYDAYQIMAHEMAHDAIAKGDINLDEIRTMLEEQFTATELDDMASQYAAAFTTADGKCVMTAEEAFEEICCDALGGINVFAELDVDLRIDYPVLDTIRSYVNDNESTQSRAPPSDGGEVKNSAESKSKYVKVSKQAWAQIQSRRMQKYGSRFDTMPDVDYIYANDRLFVVNNIGETSFNILERIDPAKNKQAADEIVEVIDNGGIRTEEKYNNWTSALQNTKRGNDSNSVTSGNRRTARRNVGLDDTAGRSSDGTGATEKGGRNSGTNVNYSAEPSENVKLAEKHFGTTYKISEAGYILTDGKMLDFSGRHEGARGGYRTVDHREIVDALGEEYGNGDYSSGMVRFMSEGNIRVSPESGGINLSVAPNKAQRSTLDRYISNFRGEVILDIDDVNGSTVASVEYPKYIHSSVVLNDIDAYFDKGRVPAKFSTEPKSKYDYSKPFAEQVDDWIDGKIPKNDSLVIGATPDVFKKVGFNALPMTINQSHVDYAVNGTKNADHRIGTAMLKQLPKALEAPVAIIASKTKNNTSIVALLPFTHNGKTVVAPVHIDGYGVQNNVVIDSNAVTSIYGRSNAVTNLLTDAINTHKADRASLFYIDTAKAVALYRNARVTMPKIPRSYNGFVASIRDSGSPVKPKFSSVTETQQFKRWFGDSKVVNEDGTPRVVYHATDADFNVFEHKYLGENTDGNASSAALAATAHLGFWFNTQDVSGKMRTNPEKTKAVYLSIQNPYYSNSEALELEIESLEAEAATPSELADAFRKQLISDGYDGIIVNDSEFGGISYVAFEPTQIKFATDNIGTFDPENPDIRYSQEPMTLKQLEAENKKLKKQLEYWRNQTRKNPKKTVREGDVKKLAKAIVESVPTDIKPHEIVPDLMELGNYILNEKELRYTEVHDMAERIATDLIENATEVVDDNKEMREELKSYLRTVKFRDDGSPEYKELRSKYRGRVHFTKKGKFVTNKGIGVDTAYMELQESLGYGLFPEEILKEKMLDFISNVNYNVQALS